MSLPETASDRAIAALRQRAQTFSKLEGCSSGAAYDYVSARTPDGKALLSIALDPRADRPVRKYLRVLRQAEEYETWAAAMRWLGGSQGR
jgi:hypothetical protein